MIERRISIGNIDPIDFYGINNAKFITLKEFFPKLKITARGDEIIIQGEESDIDVLVAKINALLEHYNKYNMLTIANLKRIILEDEIVEDPEVLEYNKETKRLDDLYRCAAKQCGISECAF